uniref:Putative glycosyltransferase n=1 Tax=viral metagenome TaxID=1070528 RepID=A0A6H1ZL59_9ZZZZ
MKLLGLIVAWNTVDFIELAIKQALSVCDEVHVCIAPHSTALEKYDDGTYDIAKKYEKDVIWLDWYSRSNHATEKSKILNTMLHNSKIYEVDNWIWTCDADEFFDDSFLVNLKGFLMYGMENCGKLLVNERYYYINMQNYLYGEHFRFFRINDYNINSTSRFYPTQNWTYIGKHKKMESVVMSHYGMLTNPHSKLDFWKTEYYGKDQLVKTRWLNEIYRNYDLSNQEYWVNRNKELFGIRSPWFSDSFRPTEWGILFNDEIQHPKLIEESGLTRIKDFRIKYNFTSEDA